MRTSLTLAIALAACSAAPEPVEPPRALNAESPFAYPLALWDERAEGETELMVYVTDEGAVDSAYVHRSSGHAAFDAAAVDGVRELRFAPARRGDRRIAMWVRLPVRFHRDGVTITIAEEETR